MPVCKSYFPSRLQPFCSILLSALSRWFLRVCWPGADFLFMPEFWIARFRFHFWIQAQATQSSVILDRTEAEPRFSRTPLLITFIM
jgi:hypothetical protein